MFSSTAWNPGKEASRQAELDCADRLVYKGNVKWSSFGISGSALIRHLPIPVLRVVFLAVKHAASDEGSLKLALLMDTLTDTLQCRKPLNIHPISYRYIFQLCKLHPHTHVGETLSTSRAQPARC